MEYERNGRCPVSTVCTPYSTHTYAGTPKENYGEYSLFGHPYTTLRNVFRDVRVHNSTESVCVRANKTKENIIIWVDNEQTICARWTHSLAFSPFHFVFFFFFFLFLSLASLSSKHIKIRTCQLLDRGFRSKFTTPFSFYHQSEYIVFRSFLRHRTCSPAKCVCPIVVSIFLAPLSSRIDWSK